MAKEKCRKRKKKTFTKRCRKKFKRLLNIIKNLVLHLEEFILRVLMHLVLLAICVYNILRKLN